MREFMQKIREYDPALWDRYEISAVWVASILIGMIVGVVLFEMFG